MRRFGRPAFEYLHQQHGDIQQMDQFAGQPLAQPILLSRTPARGDDDQVDALFAHQLVGASAGGSARTIQFTCTPAAWVFSAAEQR